MKNALFAVLVLGLIAFGTVDTNAQFKGQSNLGVGAGFGGGGLTGTGGIPLYAEYNFYNFSDNLQLGAYAAFASTSEDYNFFVAKGTWTYTNIIVAVQGNYHFSPGETFDPFVGASLGYNVASASFEWSGTKPAGAIDPTVSVGGVFYSGQAGFNYWMSPGLAVQVRVGYFPYASVGVLFNM
ncbi:MAG TPA: hypothetical protein PK559_10510 [Ignavibacteriaceae bacterium]|nr:hypothetical protein [Ignavibacteriaceae bacterium]